MGRFSNFQTLLLAFMTLGIIAAGAAIVSFAMMCRYHLHHLQDGGEGGMQICKTVYRPGDNTVTFAMVLRMVLAFVAIATVFVVCGVCCCYRLSMAREQNKHLKTVLKNYKLGQDVGKDINLNGCLSKEFKIYLATALNNQLTESKMNLDEKDVKISLISQPEVTPCGSDCKDFRIGLMEDVQLRSENRDLNMNLLGLTHDVSSDEKEDHPHTSSTKDRDVKLDLEDLPCTSTGYLRRNHMVSTGETDIISDDVTCSDSEDGDVRIRVSEALFEDASLPLVHHACEMRTA